MEEPVGKPEGYTQMNSIISVASQGCSVRNRPIEGQARCRFIAHVPGGTGYPRAGRKAQNLGGVPCKCSLTPALCGWYPLQEYLVTAPGPYRVILIA
jgi:hypothetical protein